MTTTYTDVFGGDTVPPSQNGYTAVALTADTTFFWPELASGSALMADIMEVTPDAAWSMTFPAANVVSTGRDVLVRNLGSDTITLKDSAGGTIGTVAAGVSKYLYITDNSTAAGSWTIFTFGTGTSAADAATLAGYGLVATGSTLSQQYTVTSTAVTTTVSATTDRARTIVFTNSGAVTCNLPSAATAGNGFFVNISNQGTGAVTLDGSGSETIDGEATKDLAPGESCTVVCNAVLWASIGYGRSTQFQFTKLVLDISTGTPFILTSVQAGNKLIQTIGTITGAVVVEVPAVVAVYYIQCSHTGAFSTTFQTHSGTGIALSAGDRSILYCDGVNVVQAQTATAPAANLSGGSAGVVVYQSAAGVTSFTAAGSAGEILLSGGTGTPTWSAGTGSGVPVRATGPTLSAPNLGTPASGTLTNCTGLPVSTGVSGLGTGVATALGNALNAVSGVVGVSGALGTPTSGTLTNCTGLPAAGVTGTALVSAAIGSTVLGYVAPSTSGNVLTSNGSAWTSAAPASASKVNDFRLTLTSGLPVTTADVTAASTIYCCPYKGNQISLYTGSAWVTRNSVEFSLALGTLTSGKPYDVFCYDNGGTPTLEFTAWTNDTTRATALAYQDGVLVKSGTATRRYLGTFYTTAATTTEDSAVKRYLWNYDHRVRKPLIVSDATVNWTYTTATFRRANNSASNQVEFVCGLAEDAVSVRASATISNTSAGITAAVGIGLDATTEIGSGSGYVREPATSGSAATSTTVAAASVNATFLGRHYLAWLEYSAATGTTTWTSSSLLAGMRGEIWA